MRSSFPASALVACALALHARPVRAQDGTAAAQTLFDRGIAELEAGRFEAACPALAESQRLDPRPGTLFALADCEVALGKVASALAHYHEYLGLVSRLTSEQQARHADRVESAREQVALLQSQVPTLNLSLRASAPAGLVVERDGVVLQGAALGTALPVDPGDHVVVTRAPGFPERRITLSLGTGDSKRLELPFEPDLPPVAIVAATAAPSESLAESDASNRSDARKGAGNSQRTWAFVAGGVGLAGVIVGSVTGALVIWKKSVVRDECEGLSCSPAGKQAADSGKRLGTVSDVAFGVGLGGLVTGGILWLTAPTNAPTNASALPLAPHIGGTRDAAWVGVDGKF